MKELQLFIGQSYCGPLGNPIKIVDKVEISSVLGATGYVYRGDNGGLYTRDGRHLPFYYQEGKGMLPMFDLICRASEYPTDEDKKKDLLKIEYMIVSGEDGESTRIKGYSVNDAVDAFVNDGLGEETDIHCIYEISDVTSQLTRAIPSSESETPSNSLPLPPWWTQGRSG